jgi:hypothetical protein
MMPGTGGKIKGGAGHFKFAMRTPFSPKSEIRNGFGVVLKQCRRNPAPLMRHSGCGFLSDFKLRIPGLVGH